MLSKYLGCQEGLQKFNSMKLLYLNQSIHTIIWYVYVKQFNFVMINCNPIYHLGFICICDNKWPKLSI